ncbi:MAG: histidine phosphatase family protein [Burkholderiales bacterium]|nr:histidine phosphatase family protein [Burkholderiales bacterium]
MTDLLIIRHGETDWNRELRFQGQVDVPLNATGHEQARRVAERLAGETVHHLYASDLLRTRQTAEPVRQQLVLTGANDVALRERNFGRVDGMRVDDIKGQYPDAWAQWVRFHEDFSFAGGESTRQFHARVMDAIRRLVAAHPQQTLLVVTHGGVLDMIYRSARALPLSGPRTCSIPNGGLNRLRFSGDVIDIIDWADTRHLAGLPPQPVYDQTRVAVAAPTSIGPV